MFGSELAFSITDWTAGARKLRRAGGVTWAKAAPHGLIVRAFPVSQLEQMSESIAWFE